jgi:hypothetical protein
MQGIRPLAIQFWMQRIVTPTCLAMPRVFVSLSGLGILFMHIRELLIAGRNPLVFCHYDKFKTARASLAEPRVSEVHQEKKGSGSSMRSWQIPYFITESDSSLCASPEVSAAFQ